MTHPNYSTLRLVLIKWSQKFISCEVEEAKLQFARLDTLYDNSDRGKKIEELSSEIDRLKTALSDFEEDNSRKNVKLGALEEE
ncbi:hypothetical protein C2S52_009211, partial [Perilla frutescens var. hirtella]